MKSAIVKAKVDPELKKEAEDILQQIGLTTARAITLMLHQIVMRKGLPLDLYIPSEKTEKAIADAKAGRNVKSFTSADDFFANLKGKGKACIRQSVKKKTSRKTTENSKEEART